MELKTPRGNALFNWGGKIQLIITTLKPDIEIELQKPKEYGKLTSILFVTVL